MGKKQGSKVLSLMLALALTVSTVCSGTAFAADTSSATVTVYHTNDIHGKVNSTYDKKTGALSQIGMDVLKNVKANTPNSLLVDAGDATQGVPMASYSKGADIIKLMNAAGYDVMALGNHEFDYGSPAALSNAKLAAFPVISANVIAKDGKPFLYGVNAQKAKNNGDVYDDNGGWIIKSVNGKKVGFFGITTTETAFKTNPKSLDGVTFKPEVENAKAQVAILKQKGADAIIGILHVGIDSSSNPTSHQIAQQVPGIDVIIDGHSHSTETTTVGTTVIEQTGTGATKLGKIVLSFNNGKVTATAANLTAAEVGTSFKADDSVTQTYKSMTAALEPTLNQVVGHSATSLYGGTYNGTNVCRLGETNLGDLVADAMIDGGKELIAQKAQYKNLPMVSLENGGGVRTTIPAGTITVGDVINVLPFGNSLSLKEVTPKVLYEALENGVSNDVKDGVVSPIGAFPQVSGMRFEYDISKAAGSRVTKVVLLDSKGKDAKTLSKTDASTKMILVSNDFEVAGGDSYTMLKNLPYVAEGSALDIVTANYIRELSEQSGGSFTYNLKKRIKMYNSAKALSSYNVTLTVKQDKKPLANTSVSVKSDSGSTATFKTDANGKLYIKAATGPHNIIISNKGLMGDVYVTNLASSLLNAEVNLVKVASVPTVITSDTKSAVTLANGKTYTYKVLVTGSTAPKFGVGNGKILTGKVVKKIGNAYYYQIKTHGISGQTGVYCTVNGKAQLLSYVKAVA